MSAGSKAMWFKAAPAAYFMFRYGTERSSEDFQISVNERDGYPRELDVDRNEKPGVEL